MEILFMTPAAPHSPSHPDLGHLTPREAFDFLQRHPETVFIDIRMELEHFFVGHPPKVINIPWQDYPDFDINPTFLSEVRHVVQPKDRPIILLCRSGHRSIDAGNALIAAGFKTVYNVLEGFEGDRNDQHHRSSLNGWRFYGLPWVQC
jgi:rhodanese-related sulfurtransferase